MPLSAFGFLSRPRLCRLAIDLLVVCLLISSMLYVALDGNTWAQTPLRIIPTLVGCALFTLSLLIIDRIYESYKQWSKGWSPLIKKEASDDSGTWRWTWARKWKARESESLQHLSRRETLTSRLLGGLLRLHSIIRKRVHRICSRPSFTAAVILWAIGFSLTWCSTLGHWRREDVSDRWDFHKMTTRDYVVQEVFLAAATVEFALSFIHQIEVMHLVFSPVFWVEMATLPPCVVLIYISFRGMLGDYRISQVLLLTGSLRWLKSFVFVRFVGSIMVWGNNTKGQIVRLIMGISLLLLTFASAMFTAESVHPDNSPFSPTEHAFLAFWNYFYFGAVTMSTVGYGDIYPTTVFGQVLCVVFIVTSLVWVPREFAILIESFSSRRKIVGSLPLNVFGSSFVLLIGDEARLRCSSPPKLVILTPKDVDSYTRQLQEARLGRVRVCVVNGEAGIGGHPGDLRLVLPHQARGVFILSPPASFNVFSDRQVLTRIMSVLKEGVDPRSCCVQLGTENCANAIATMGVTSYMILSDLKMGLISRSLSDCPGIIPLITNLCGSIYPDLPLGVLRKKFSLDLLEHIEAYIRGASHALYSFAVPNCMLDLGFEEVAINLFSVAGIITLGLQRSHILPRHMSSTCSTRLSAWENGGVGCLLPCFSGGLPVSGSSFHRSSRLNSGIPAGVHRDDADDSYWLNPCGKGCILRPGDRLVIIASSVAVAECLQSSTRLPWGVNPFRVGSLFSHLRNVGDRNSPFGRLGCFTRRAAVPPNRDPHPLHNEPPSSSVSRTHIDGDRTPLNASPTANMRESGIHDAQPTSTDKTMLGRRTDFPAPAAGALGFSRDQSLGQSPEESRMHADSARLHHPSTVGLSHSFQYEGSRFFPLPSQAPRSVDAISRLSRLSTPGALSPQPTCQFGASLQISRQSSQLTPNPTTGSHSGGPRVRFETDEEPTLPVVCGEPLNQEEEDTETVAVQERRRQSVSGFCDSASSEELLDRLGDVDTSTLFVHSALEAYEHRFADSSKPLIVVCGWPKFLSRLLRKLSVGNGSNVVVLAAATPPTWSDLKLLMPFAHFTAVINGHPLNEMDLIRAGALEAQCTYIFPLALDNTIYEGNASIEQHNDRNAILVYLQMRHLLVHKTDVLKSAAARHNSGLSSRHSSSLMKTDRTPAGKRGAPSQPHCSPPGPPPKGLRPPPPRMGFWRRPRQGGPNNKATGVKNVKSGAFKFSTPFIFHEFVGGELLILELQDHDNWRFISDAEWIEGDPQQAPCYSAASYLHSTAYMSGSLFCDRMLYTVITQNPALSQFSVLPVLIMELVGNTLVTSGTGIQLEELPEYAFAEEGTFGRLFEMMLRRENKIPLALYRRGLGTLEHYVITSPPKDTLLKKTDRVYLLHTGVERMSLTAARVVKRINAHLARSVRFKGVTKSRSSVSLM